jgi:hypothetical protein
MVRLDRVDKVIWVLPILGILDVLSTFYAEWLGYSLLLYEVGSLASFFAELGLLNAYIPVYLLFLVGVAYAFWYIKNRVLHPSHAFDRVLFLLLVIVAGYVCVRLTATIIGNVLLPYYISGKVSSSAIMFFVYLSTALALTLYLGQGVLMWLKTTDDQKG